MDKYTCLSIKEQEKDLKLQILSKNKDKRTNDLKKCKEIITELEKKNELLKDNKTILELMKENKLKDDEIKLLKSKFQFEILKDDKIMTIIFTSIDQMIHYSFICKNTDIFIRLENLLYDKYPKYRETQNFFISNGNIINRFKTLEENNIKNSDIITLNEIE